MLAPTIVADLAYWSTGDTTSALSVQTPGVYSVYAKNECGVVKDSVYVMRSVTSPRTLDEVVKAYPNPTSGKLHLVCRENLQFSILNAQGHPLMLFNAQKGTQVIDVSQLPSGWYVLTASGSTSKGMKPLKLGIQSH